MALDALDAAHIPLQSNIRFIWEGEEEAGSHISSRFWMRIARSCTATCGWSAMVL
jgi:acetylornithine deacetylase/succinyl-diaminopimelate desuccinylase-like protein